MNKLLVICALVALIEAAPQVNRYYNQQQQQQYQYNPSYKQPLILRQTQIINPDGSYEYAYDTENGISAQERGALRQFSPQEAGEVAQGSFSYTAPDGQVIQVQYVADENGFQPQGAHIPTPPPIPAEILRSIQYIESVEQKQQKPYRF